MKHIALILLLASTSAAVAQDRTTTVEDARGSRTTITTDSLGTRSRDNSSGRDIYSSGGNRHDEQVQKHTGSGGRVVDDR